MDEHKVVANWDWCIYLKVLLFTKIMFSSLLRADLMMFINKICYPEFGIQLEVLCISIF